MFSFHRSISICQQLKLIQFTLLKKTTVFGHLSSLLLMASTNKLDVAVEPSNRVKIFVYGTLKKDQPNHHFLNDIVNGQARFVCCANTVEKYPLLVATRYTLPFLINLPEVGNRIIGEVYEIDSKMLSFLDEFEDYPDMYNRREKKVEVCAKEGQLGEKIEPEIITCWVYLLEKYPKEILDNRELLENYDAYSQKVLYTLEDGGSSSNIYEALEEDCRLRASHKSQ